MKQFYYILTILLFTACFKDSDVFIPDPITPVVNVRTSIGGTVIDDDNAPVPGALVQLGTETKETDDNGIFIFRDVEVDSRRAYVKVTKAGYFSGSRAILPDENAITNVRVQLLTDEDIGTIAATAGGDLVLPGGAVIAFPTNAVANYSGDIHVATRYLDPTGNDLGWKMPGNLTGLDEANQTKALTSFGMIAIKLLDENGNLLQLAEGKSLEITLPVPTELLNEAPALPIPLWSYNEETAIWEERGSASLEGDNYVGKITGGTYWNFAEPFDQVNLSGIIVDENQLPIPNFKLNILNAVGAVAAAGWTDNTGRFSAKIPAGEPLFINIVDGCDIVVMNESIGTFIEADNTFDATIRTNNFDTFTNISGRILNCENESATEGYVYIKLLEAGYEVVMINTDGTYEANLLNCAADQVSIKVIDVEQGLESFTADYYGSEVKAGSIVVCSDLIEYITYTIDEDRFLEKEPYASSLDGLTIIGGESTGPLLRLEIEGASRGTGFETTQITANELTSAQSVMPTVSVNFNTYEEIGGFITGVIDGVFKDEQGFDRNISGTFRIIRDN